MQSILKSVMSPNYGTAPVPTETGNSGKKKGATHSRGPLIFCHERIHATGDLSPVFGNLSPRRAKDAGFSEFCHVTKLWDKIRTPPKSGQIQESTADCLADSGGQATHMQLVKAAFDLLRGGMLADFELISNFLAVQALGRKLENLALALGQGLGPGDRAELAKGLEDHAGNLGIERRAA